MNEKKLKQNGVKIEKNSSKKEFSMKRYEYFKLRVFMKIFLFVLVFLNVI